jgi:hypothetical protein
MYGCAPSSFCLADAFDPDPNSYVCLPKRAELASCVYDRFCSAGLSCGMTYVPTTGGQQRWAEACVPSPGVGESCRFANDPQNPEFGTSLLTCAAGAYCADDGVCHALPEVGEVCLPDGIPVTFGTDPNRAFIQCAPSLRCVDSWEDGHCE